MAEKVLLFISILLMLFGFGLIALFLDLEKAIQKAKEWKDNLNGRKK